MQPGVAGGGPEIQVYIRFEELEISKRTSADRRSELNDPLNLERFVDAQELEYSSVLEELRAGEKLTHWMWFVFPQVRGLGSSPTAEMYAISSLDEARAYLDHDVLGSRLDECTRLVLAIDGRTAEAIFHYPDFLKFRSCMTLFAECAPGESVFRDALAKYFEGQPDERTLGILREMI
jgi:uncharacterized protein (DUF1810 family)